MLNSAPLFCFSILSLLQPNPQSPQHSVHYVTADCPLGTRLNQDDQIPVLSSGTTEHDLIPSAILDAVLTSFLSKLDPLNATGDQAQQLQQQ
ncbi:unnamed protein product [Dicrocoelium dendriticum]|nr:unnamed protein product [Dicrocoelium dendriticum]